MHRTGLDATAELRSHGLHAIADAEHRYAELEYRGRSRGRTCDRHRLGTARKNDALGAEGADVRLTRIPGVDLAVHAEFAHTPRNELGVLRTEIENQNPVGVDVGRCSASHEMR